MKVYRTEFPNPQFERENWLCLNGEWEFEKDLNKVGRYKKFWERDSLSEKINVPFCPESDLSGIGYKEFMPMVWYRKEITLPEAMKGKRVFLHFGAVDWHSFIYVNGELACEHKGGYVPFAVEVTKYGESFTVVVCAEDDMCNKPQCYGYGKQSHKLNSYGCSYTRTTGIWQTVWLEATGDKYISDFRVTPVLDSKSVSLEVEAKDCYGATVTAEAYYEGKKMGETTFAITDGNSLATLSLAELHLWELGAGRLYDLKLTLTYNGVVMDEVKSYFGMRSVYFDGMKFMLNGKSVFGRFVLDQGFYHDGIYTAPTVDRFVQDIQISMDMGFNGARLHEKIFEPMMLYYCDKMGYMVWDEYPDWGVRRHELEAIVTYLPEWITVLKRDYNHPSIIGWCCRNEVWDVGRNRIDDEQVRIAYMTTKLFDKSRPVLDASGGLHVETDQFDVHDYDGNIESYANKYASGFNPRYEDKQTYKGQPYWISEYGGIKYIPFGEDSGWGYGDAAKTEEEFVTRYVGITESMYKNPNIWAMCYTQLYDVEQEVNGLYTYERVCKFTPEGVAKIKACNQQKAVIED